MQKVNEKQVVRRVKGKVHSHNTCIIVVPDQYDFTHTIYKIAVDNNFGIIRPKDTILIDYEYCPYCGEKLIETYEVEKSDG